MKLSAEVDIAAKPEQVWKVMTNKSDCASFIEALDLVEILEEPKTGLVGLKWKETRTLFGKTATEIMWVTESVDNKYYKTRAENHGAIYISTISIEEIENGTKLTMDFDSTAQTFGAKIMAGIFGLLFKNATIRALQKDLEDIKNHLES
jgi:carbon monoxide dehydrogenase subunit G